MSVMVWAYARMSAALRGRAIGECTHHQMQVVRAKRKVSIVSNSLAISNYVNVDMLLFLLPLTLTANKNLLRANPPLAPVTFASHGA